MFRKFVNSSSVAASDYQRRRFRHAMYVALLCVCRATLYYHIATLCLCDDFEQSLSLAVFETANMTMKIQFILY